MKKHNIIDAFNIFKREQRRTFILIGLALTSASLLMTGCASPPPQASAMVPNNLTASKHYHGSVSVNVTCSGHADIVRNVDGIKRDADRIAVIISNEDFSSALAETLKQCALFSSVTHTNEDYRLNVDFKQVRMPDPADYALVTTIASQWQLIRIRDSAVLMDENVATPYFAQQQGTAFTIRNHLRMAVEGAARANIAEGIRRLSELNLEE
jgi:hypothetical protein